MKKQNHLVVGILAHVDAGKTTLSEGLLFKSGSIRKPGRVDHRDAFLDMNEMERERGITIFSKQARMELGKTSITLLDTPGHVDFSAEMERTLPLLDYAILVISGADGVQAHTRTLWKLLRRYHIPVFLFLNKMDQQGLNREVLFREIQEQLSEQCVDFANMEENREDFFENLALCSEEAMDCYLEQGELEQERIVDMIAKRQVFPCYFGSALKMEGVDALLTGLGQYTQVPLYPAAFAARIYKIGRDDKGNRLTYLKVTGGALHVKDILSNAGQQGTEGEFWQEKVNQIRLYSGAQFQTVQEAEAGMICAVTGLTKTFAGQGLGAEEYSYIPVLEPVLNYRVVFPAETDMLKAYQQMQEIEEEEPLMHIVWNPEWNEIHAQMMGEVQCEIVKRMMLDRFGMDITFAEGSIVYKETIAAPVEGVGHFEPLKHYAEVHLLLEPGPLGSGIQIDTMADEDQLHRNWQRLILTHLLEKRHKGVLVGGELTDVRITLAAGRAHKKHTEGGDFRQATYRAVRQGLMQAESVLLEPMYAFTLTIPADKVGRAMTDIQNAYGRFEAPELLGEVVVIQGVAPVSTMQDYQRIVLQYTQGEGSFQCRMKGYEPCHNTDEVVEEIGYDAQGDMENTGDSVFCAHGAGFVVSWNQVREYMHVDSGLDFGEKPEKLADDKIYKGTSDISNVIDEEELEEIFQRTFAANQNNKKRYHKKSNHMTPAYTKPYRRPVFRDRYLLVDGYNIIFAWEDLKRLSQDNLAGARNRLMDMMCNYQAYKRIHLILVFDAYKVSGNPGEAFDYHNIHVVYTKEAQTADAYIEKFTHEMGHQYDITVATSDALEQLIVLGQGAKRLSARAFQEEVEQMQQELRENYLDREYE